MHGPATRRPPFFMQAERSTLQCLGARFTATAAPRSFPEDFLLFFAIENRIAFDTHRGNFDG